MYLRVVEPVEEPHSAVNHPSRISSAIVVWTGWGETAWPVRDDGRVVARFGEVEAMRLMESVRVWAADFFASDADVRVAELAAMGKQAEEDFRLRHPEASDDAVRALGWCYTFDLK